MQLTCPLQSKKLINVFVLACEVWMVPRAASRWYTGREELGDRLAQAFSYNVQKPPAEQRIFVIVGIGGTGKSEVCLKFAQDHRDE